MIMIMRVAHFQFDLPDELIARYPLPERRASRLLVLDGPSGAIAHQQFTDLLDYLRPGDLMVFNNTRVIPARLFAKKVTGGKVEVLVERVLATDRVLAHVRSSKAPKIGSTIELDGGAQATLLARHDSLFEWQFSESVLPLLERIGHMPLPPYMERADEHSDHERYQTVNSIRDLGVATAFVTLHVGAGTFQPVRVDTIEEHKMHHEWLEVSQQVVDAVAACKARGGRVIAVGTTSVRSLESAAQATGELQTFVGETDIFLYPGRSFNVVDALVTNFHLSESTLLMLVAAFAGYPEIMQAYHSAVEQRYRFFSYGDAMFITRNPQPRSPKE